MVTHLPLPPRCLLPPVHMTPQSFPRVSSSLLAPLPPAPLPLPALYLEEGVEDDEVPLSSSNVEDEDYVFPVTGPPQGSSQTQFKLLRFKNVKDIHSTVKTYGPNAPFTISFLEALPGGGFLLPGEWIRIVQSVLSRGQFLTWKADFVDRCQTLAAANQRNPNSPTARWSIDKLCGQGRYAK